MVIYSNQFKKHSILYYIYNKKVISVENPFVETVQKENGNLLRKKMIFKLFATGVSKKNYTEE